MQFNGMKVFRSLLATQPTIAWEVVRVAIPKRRKRWRVIRTTRQIPCAMEIAGALHVHPAIYDPLAAQKGQP